MNPIYHQAKFINSSPHLKNTPADEGLEIAFAGRSNAGKSSAINTLTRQNSLARISKTPGRTQMLNFFEINERLRFVDLPGYGYAKVPLDVKQEWHKLMETYLLNRKSLCAIILVMDIRHPLTEFDWQMVEWCQHSALPLHILLTKADKLTYGAGKNTLLQVQRELKGFNMPMSIQLFSSLKKIGVDEVHQALDKLFTAAPQLEMAEGDVGQDG
ncbi:MAG: YihA family ribosome biogenesis GTP-binding protein [Methylobacter sp.]|uniref:ribosome biogenesis GTP-binding protein YihA/YsxC n=1 Tax=Methylovulum miyakonense TaxID=645578 RepID=UPI00036EB753|nr:ribosome biogenesis GTP-binding protein YihA/YsxC [Methylovulum miyakonense]PPD46971.1 MAG: YihA family ribosome biogenesis GTP-binding protein [Methylobacter sp.]